MKTWSRLARLVVVLASVILVCNIVFRLPPRLVSGPGDVPDFSATPLARAAQALHSGSAANSGVYSLADAREAFAARVLLLRAATHSVDAQYYIWHADLSGKILMHEVLRAADRGVKVRLIIDDNTTAGEDRDLAALSAHENVEVRLFNPFTIRRPRLLNYVMDFPRLNRRMHNKSMTADGSLTIVGGRNIGDEYFAANESMQYADADLLILGRAADDVSQNFERFWNSESTFPAEQILPVPTQAEVTSAEGELAALAQSNDARQYLGLAETSHLIQDLTTGAVPLEWAKATVFSDDPQKDLGKVEDRQLLATSISGVLNDAAQQLDIASAYFVPGTNGTEFLKRFASRGVDVRLLTNTLASNDVATVHAGYLRYRRNLLEAGVQLFELMTDKQQLEQKKADSPELLFGASSASLHAKLFVMDKSKVFIGSYNFDPRSLYLNCEMGVLVESPAIAGYFAQQFDQLAANRSYGLSLVNGQVEWAGGGKTFSTDPDSTLMQRAVARALSVLPLEWLL